MSAALYQPGSRVQARRFGLVCQAGNAANCYAERVTRMFEAGAPRLRFELVTHTCGCIGIREEHRAECNVCRTTRNQLERIASGARLP